MDAMTSENERARRVDATRQKRERAEHLARRLSGYGATIATNCAGVRSSNRPESDLAGANGLIGNMRAALDELDALIPEIQAEWSSAN